jgi:hypothetical protein
MAKKPTKAPDSAPKRPQNRSQPPAAAESAETASPPERRPGRPQGAKSATDVVTVEPSRCRACGSTSRTPYTNTTEHEHRGLHEGRPYTHVVWRTTSCADCGQSRRDRHLENRPEAE